MENRITPENITTLKQNQFFVYGSNENGWDGAGAALTAFENFKRPLGKGFGPHVTNYANILYHTFAIPTKSWNMSVLHTNQIAFYVDRFIQYTKEHPKNTFLVTEIGCGYSGYKPEHIAPLFLEAKLYDNIHLPQRFWDVLNKTK